jgi:hypothetical protein
MGLGILAIIRQQSPFRVGIFFSLRRLGRFEFLILFFLAARKYACNRNRNNAIDAAALFFSPLPEGRWLLWFTNFTVSAVELASSLFVHHQHESHRCDLAKEVPDHTRSDFISSSPFL